LKKAGNDPRGLSLGQLPECRRHGDDRSVEGRSFGIPDVSKIEWKDKTSAAKRHADMIRERRSAREQARKDATVN
jgi:hypothetical protein